MACLTKFTVDTACADPTILNYLVSIKDSTGNVIYAFNNSSTFSFPGITYVGNNPLPVLEVEPALLNQDIQVCFEQYETLCGVAEVNKCKEFKSTQFDNCTGTSNFKVTVKKPDGRPVQNAIVNINSQPAGLTNVEGCFIIPCLPDGAQVTLTGDDVYQNGLSVLDSIKIKRHILQQEQFSEYYQWIASDTLDDGDITTFDDVNVLNVVNNNTPLPGDNWRFTPKESYDSIIPGVAFPINGTTYDPNYGTTTNTSLSGEMVAIKVGDLNCSANTVLTNTYNDI